MAGPYQPTPGERTQALLAHGSIILNLTTIFGSLLVAFLIWLLKGTQSSWLSFQALIYQAVNVAAQITLWTIVLFIVYTGLTRIPLACLVGLVLGPAIISYGLYGTYRAYQGMDFRYWLLGDFLEKRRRRL